MKNFTGREVIITKSGERKQLMDLTRNELFDLLDHAYDTLKQQYGTILAVNRINRGGSDG